jgi:hypothetical protein
VNLLFELVIELLKAADLWQWPATIYKAISVDNIDSRLAFENCLFAKPAEYRSHGFKVDGIGIEDGLDHFLLKGTSLELGHC